MVNMYRILIEGSIYSILFLVILLTSLAYNPRIWLQDYPKDIQRLAKPKSKTEERQFLLIGSVVMLLTLAPLLSSIVLDGAQITFWSTFIQFYLIFTMVSLSDLIILDWLIFCIITPSFIIIPGTQGARGYKNFRFHFTGFLKGAIIYGAFSLILAGIRIAVTYI
ncbi:nitroreductase [Paenibacillus popilliae]|uniref:Nitroreductase n=1 Tax=Paenibacillus popilliae TaxID=78057 RepID=A0ABY3APU7_PAEPP|nr:nitroreductase [Paenibacillus sp. SDF0028]TQR44635.1 nitroreductase [Paenibacillus sp. SDF0028]